MKMKNSLPAILVLLCGLAIGRAQPPDTEDGWSFEVGGGFIYSPAFSGSSDYQLKAVPAVRVTYGDVFFASVWEGAGYRLLQGADWSAGPLVKMDFGRDADGNSSFKIAGKRSTALRGFADIDNTMQVGAFLKGRMESWSGGVEILQGVNGHEGLTAEFSLNFRTDLHMRDDREGAPLILATGPRMMWGGADYNTAYYGVSSTDAFNTGLPAYRAGSGLVSAGWGVTGVQPLSRRLTLIAMLNYTRLVGDAADSPLVQQRGDANQWMTGVFLSYKL